MLLKDSKKQVEIPHEKGQSMTLRKLSWRELEQASEEHQVKALKRMQTMGADILSAFINTSGDQAQQQDQGQQFDKRTVLVAGIVSWSYEDDVTPENIDLLDADTSDWAYREILELNKEGADSRKKG